MCILVTKIPLLRPIGSFFRFGRKITLIAGGVPMIVGWILIGCADSIIYLYAGRFLHGLTVGVTFLVLPYYLAEIASDKIRGFLTTMFSVMMQLGVLYVYAIGHYLVLILIGPYV